MKGVHKRTQKKAATEQHNKHDVEKVDYITQSSIIGEYGWTKTLIDRFLPEPILKTNPKYACAAPMKLWDRAVVLAAMEGDEFRKAYSTAQKRKAAGQKAAQTKVDALMNEINEKIADIEVEVLPDEELIQQVLYEKQDIYDIEDKTMVRWTVNFIRHELTTYDAALWGIAGKPGCRHAYLEYKSAVLDAIAKAYPQYKGECNRQKEYTYEREMWRDLSRFM